MIRPRNLCRRAALLLALAAAVAVSAADFDYRLQPRKLADGAYAFIGAREDFDTVNGGNIVNTGFLVGSDGIVVIDSGPSKRYGEQMRAAIALVSSRPVALTILTHHHPDHMLGNQAFAGTPIGALAPTVAGIAADGNGFAENLFRLSGDWMKGTEVVVPNRTLQPGRQQVAGRWLRLIALAGHTHADLAVYDEKSGILFAGDIVFNDRAPTTPHASIDAWLKALAELEAITREPGFVALLPGHGEPARDAAPIRQTREWLLWLRATLNKAAADGLDMTEVLALPLPARWASMPLAAIEYRRSVGHLYPAIEAETLAHAH
ncbi:quinoprotein relay system zinc metallohydrolase 1 [Azonexus sp. R2A61]|uniref:quinoprotein relay system zinc metallohydrolase 1 n=1 Tax=Azonexus sp. R2A61 TaxID=2744443 RepID=UPI001F2B85E4|nr:quinoprotein relay system zinc metallohydrolase 1 [Azonexus sp. R2A61]